MVNMISFFMITYLFTMGLLLAHFFIYMTKHKKMNFLLKSGRDTLTSVGFGSFKPVQKEERQDRNPCTEQTINIPASKSVRFSVGKGLKDTLNG